MKISKYVSIVLAPVCLIQCDWEFYFVRMLHFQITITGDIDDKFVHLMESCLSALATLLEIVEFSSAADLSTFVNEMLTYIRAMVAHVPEKSIACIKQLIKIMFSMNYQNRKLSQNLYDFRKVHGLREAEIFEYLTTFKTIVAAPPPIKRPTETTPSKPNTLINFLASATPEKTNKPTDSNNIKVFEPLVIHCLKV